LPQDLVGRSIAHYRVTGELGQGGMGEVYRARDSKLERDVAIKVLPAAFTADRERLARFEREAQMLAQIQHPNIASIYGIEESEGLRALVMELVEGPTLAERLEGGPLAQDEALSVALQIARALEEAHEKGIVHRDLKPQNVKASIDGKVKVLDFGLAKAMEPAGTASGAGSELAKSPTLTLGATQMGVILGTAGYMSPEQAKGMPIDKRADIWSFGVVLHEMLAGGSLFEGDSVGDTLAAVIRAPIELGKLPAGTPAAIRRLLRLCLERNPKNRLHDIADARIALEEVHSGRADAEPTPAAAPAARPSILAYAVAAAGLVFGLVALWRPWAKPVGSAVEAPAFRLEIGPLENATSLPGLDLSPDGTQLVFVARTERSRPGLWLRRLDAPDARLLPGTEGARFPFWAPDGKRIGFFAGGQLKVTDLVGTPRVLASTGATVDARGGAWGSDDTLVFAPTFHGGLRQVSARGGAAAPLTEPPPNGELGTYRFPSFLPDGKRFLFYGSAGSGLEPGQLLLGRLGSTEVKSLGESHSRAVLAPPDRVLYVRGDQLVAQRLDLAKEELVGDPVPLGVTLAGGIAVSGHRSLSVSRTGIIALRQDTRSVTSPGWFDREGRELEALTEAGGKAWWYAPRLAPGGRRATISRYEVGASNGDIWVYDLERALGTRLTFEDGEEQLAIWAPDGKELVYSSTRPGRPYAMYFASPERPGDARLWFESPLYMLPDFYTPEGRDVVYEQSSEDGEFALYRRAIAGGEPRMLFSDPGSEYSAALSPDGLRVTYCSDATRRVEVYARRLDGSDSAIQVSDQGGCQPLWGGDGRSIYYVAEDGMLMEAAVESGSPLRVGPPRALLNPHLEDGTDRQYDVAPDGQRFLVNRRTGDGAKPVLVLSGWDRALADGRRP
jgi:Tol biopolymer transport system component